MLEFPKGFLWGAATSAHQVEGNNINSDWWEWEKRVGLPQTSGQACRHYQLYKEDFALASQLSHNVHRLSVEWSRIEPEEGRFREEEINHYREVILSLKQLNIEPIVTLHHFTSPLWLAKLSGWDNRKIEGYFLRYVEKVVGALCDKVDYWVTINEPMVYTYYSYIMGSWPPQEKSFLKAKKVIDNMANSHIKAYGLIHDIYSRKKLSSPSVSIAHNMQAFVPCNPALKNRFAVYLRDKIFNRDFIERLIRNNTLDFIGVNYYTRGLIEVEGWGLNNLLMDVCKKGHDPLKKNTMGWDIYPRGIHDLLLKLKKYNLPVFILENGICVDDDNTRWEYIYEHLKNVHLAIEQGVKVLGYIYWSLLDNFEWDKGFIPRFGLIEVDYHTYKRTIRESARKFSLVCKSNQLN